MRVKISIKNEDVRAYTRYMFSGDTDDDGVVVIKRMSDVGKLCCSLVSYCDTPDNREGDDIMTFILPCAPSTSSARAHFCHFTLENQGKVVDYITFLKRLDFQQYWVVGLISGIRKKSIIESYIYTRGLCNINSESQCKAAYRLNKTLLDSKIKYYYDIANAVERKIKEEQTKYIRRHGV